MANRVFLTGVGTEAVRKSEEKGETLCIWLEVRMGSETIHVKVLAENPPVVNFLRAYHCTRPLFVTGTLRSDSDGSLYINAESVDYARASATRKPNYGFEKLNRLPTEKFVNR